MDTNYVPTDGFAKKKFKAESEIQSTKPNTKPSYVMVAPMYGQQGYGGQPLATTVPSSSAVLSEAPTAATTSMTVTLTGPPGSGTGAVAQGGGGGGKHREEERHPKVSVQQVTQRLLSRLMLEGGLPLNDLTRSIPDATRETVLSVLEVLQVMGVVTQVKVKAGIVLSPDGILVPAHPPGGESSGSGTSSGVAVSALYYISSMTRTPETQDLRTLQQAISTKKANAARIRERCTELLSLTNREMLRPERLVELQSCLTKLKGDEPNLKDDLLYRTIGDLCAASVGVGASAGVSKR